MLTPDDLSLAESLLREGRVDPRLLESQMSMAAGQEGPGLRERLRAAGVPVDAAAAFTATLAPNGESAPVAGEPVGTRKRLGRYVIVRELARGGMGVVYRGLEPSLGREVAIKVLLAGEGASPDQIERFVREARAAAALQHPGIVQIYDVGQAEGQHYFVMELVNGESLDAAIRTGGALAPRRALQVTLQAARALEHAHGRGVIHRDVKPANILLSRDAGTERVILTDFGLAKDMGAGSGLTLSGALIGTPAYMSPEQADGRLKDIDARSDVYSLGAVLFEAVSGKPPFRAPSLAELLDEIANGDIPSLAGGKGGVLRDIELIVLKAMHRDPGRRYASAGEMAADLERCLAGESVLASAPSLRDRWARWAGRNRALVASATISLAAVLGLCAWAAGRSWYEARQAAAQADAARAASESVARRHLERVAALTASYDFEGAQVEAGLAAQAAPWMEEAAREVDETRVRRLQRLAEDRARAGDWDGMLEILNSAPELAGRAEMQRLSRVHAGTCILRVETAEEGVEADLGDARGGEVWEEDIFPGIAEARAVGLCRPLGPLPTGDCDVPFGDHVVVFSRGGRVIRLVPVRLARAAEMRVRLSSVRVGSSGEARQRSLAAALEGALPGTEIRLEPGDWPGGLQVPPGVRIAGIPGLPRPRIDGANAESALDASASHGSQLERLDVSGGKAATIRFSSCFRPRLVDCRVRGSGGAGVVVDDCADTLIRDCEIDGCRSGIVGTGSRALFAVSVRVAAPVDAGIEMDCPDTSLERCRVTSAGGAGIYVRGQFARIVACEILGARESGIFLKDSSRSIVEDNLVVDAVSDPEGTAVGGITTYGGGRVVIRFNTVSGGGASTGLYMIESGGDVSHNIVAFQKGRGFFSHGVGFSAERGPDVNFADWNVIHGCGGWARFYHHECPTPEALKALPDFYGKVMVHVLTADPMFIDRDGGNFRLREGSPVRGAGEGGATPGVRWELLEADAVSGAGLVRRELARRLIRDARVATEKDRARRLAATARLVDPGAAGLAELEEMLR